MDSNFAVNGEAFIVEPKSASISYYTLDGESERNANGKLIRQIIRTNVRKVEIEFGPITTTEAKQIIGLLQSSSNFKFTCPSPKGGIEEIDEAYCGDIQLGYLRTNYSGTINRGSTTQTVSEGVSFNGARSGSDGDALYDALYDGLKVSIIEY